MDKFFFSSNFEEELLNLNQTSIKHLSKDWFLIDGTALYRRTWTNLWFQSFQEGDENFKDQERLFLNTWWRIK